MTYIGAESLSGPWPVDQNNAGSHYYHMAATAFNVTWNLTSSSQAVDQNTTEVASFAASVATLYPTVVGQAAANSTSGTTAVLTSYVPYRASDLFAVVACTTATTGTIAVADPTNGSYTTIDTAVNHNGVRCQTFYKSGASGSTVTITATFGTSAGFTNIMLKEIANATTLDQHSGINATTASGYVYTGTSVTTTHANEALIEFAMCANCDLATGGIISGTSTASWTQDTNDGAGNVMGYWVVGGTGTYHASPVDNSSATSAGVTGIITFY